MRWFVLCLVVLAVFAPAATRSRLRGRKTHPVIEDNLEEDLFSRATHAGKKRRQGDVDFLGTSYVKDGEVEVRLSYQGINVLETQLPGVGENGLFLREVTDGHRLVKAVFQGEGNLVDCDILKSDEDVDKFLLRFTEPGYIAEGLSRAARGSKHNQGLPNTSKYNTTFTVLTKSLLSHQHQEMVNFKEIKLACRQLHQEIRATMRGQKRQEHSDNEEREDSVPAEEGVRSRRAKRSMFIYPGTNWCGKGNVAKSYDDLGDSFDTDKCCRQHDHCPYIIEGFTSKFNLFNYRFHTMSHCNCDESFRHCLKTTNSPVSAMVGSLYFNMMGLNCFTLKPNKVCTKRSWWGNCLKWEKQYMAVVQDAEIF